MYDQNPENWKWGIFYYNPKDTRIFVAKRIASLGWTANFAKPYSILVFFGLIALIALLTKFLT